MTKGMSFQERDRVKNQARYCLHYVLNCCRTNLPFKQNPVSPAGQNPIVEDGHVVRGAVFGKHG